MPLDDRQLVTRTLAGERRAYEELVRRYQRQVFGIARGVLRQDEDAADVAQEAFLRAYRALDRFKGDCSFYTWLYRITLNLALDAVKRRNRAPLASYEEEADVPDSAESWPSGGGPSPLEALSRRELAQVLARGMDTLSPTHRAALTLREIEDLSYKEIADIMECNIGTVMSRLFHARQNLRKAIAGYLEEEDE